MKTWILRLTFILVVLPFSLPPAANSSHLSKQALLEGVRACLYQPGVSVPAEMPLILLNPATATPLPAPTPFVTTLVSPDTRDNQLAVFDGLWNAVNENYVYTDFRGKNWSEIGERYRMLIEVGLSDDDFYAAMRAMIRELGDEHSYFQSPAEIAAEAAALQGRNDFVGIGTLLLPIGDGSTAVVMAVFRDSPAADAGIVSHDIILGVDGGPVRDETGSRTLGPEGSSVTVTIQRPGEAPIDLVLTRRRVTGSLPIDYCMIPDTRIGYIFVPTLLDETIDDQIREALQRMTAEGVLDGLILDNRLNGGGLGSVTQDILSMFVGGLQGHFVSRETIETLELQPEDIGGSQTVPLVVLVDKDTVSYGEILSGVLRVAGRASIVGGATQGNVERLRRFDFADGSRAWIATDTFEPLGQANGIWEDEGIIPDVLVPTRWELFTEANDPALAISAGLLMGQ